jgi:hypothetical protein
MQPCFGIKYDLLVKYYGDFRALALDPSRAILGPVPGENQLSPTLNEVGND